MTDTAFRLSPRLCPHCGHTLDAASQLAGTAKPKPGDFSVCIKCAGVLIFDRQLHPVKPLPGVFEKACEEDHDLAAQIARIQAAVRRLPAWTSSRIGTA